MLFIIILFILIAVLIFLAIFIEFDDSDDSRAHFYQSLACVLLFVMIAVDVGVFWSVENIVFESLSVEKSEIIFKYQNGNLLGNEDEVSFADICDFNARLEKLKKDKFFIALGTSVEPIEYHIDIENGDFHINVDEVSCDCASK